ncbi:unnamed protein product [Cylicocyclus nassatus]|uniref:Uncharacterized protein n=1 Tax=Cylicocyclus nassatus TaxID=53992 RepID=A0AA36MG17_CYLNA|nr:unnamed protein product [Cylicocyclus nassatus]
MWFSVTTAQPYTPLAEESTTVTEEKENTKEEATTAAQEETTMTAMTSECEQPRGTRKEEFTPIFEGQQVPQLLQRDKSRDLVMENFIV